MNEIHGNILLDCRTTQGIQIIGQCFLIGFGTEVIAKLLQKLFDLATVGPVLVMCGFEEGVGVFVEIAFHLADRCVDIGDGVLDAAAHQCFQRSPKTTFHHTVIVFFNLNLIQEILEPVHGIVVGVVRQFGLEQFQQIFGAMGDLVLERPEAV